MHVNNFFVCGPKFTNLFSPHVGGVVLDELLFRFTIYGYVPEIFALKIESCQKLRRILNVFRHPKFQGGGHPKTVLTPGSRHVVWIKNCDDIPISPDVIDVHPLNFKANIKFSRLKFLGRPPSQFGCTLGSVGQSLASVKNSGSSTPKGRNIVSRKMSTWVGQYARQQLFRLWTKVHGLFFVQRGRGCS